MGIEIFRYDNQFQLGITLCFHDDGNGRHFHLWFDLGIYCIEITIGGKNAD